MIGSKQSQDDCDQQNRQSDLQIVVLGKMLVDDHPGAQDQSAEKDKRGFVGGGYFVKKRDIG